MFYCSEPSDSQQECKASDAFSHGSETLSGSRISSRHSIIPHVPGMGRTFTSRLGARLLEVDVDLPALLEYFGAMGP